MYYIPKSKDLSRILLERCALNLRRECHCSFCGRTQFALRRREQPLYCSAKFHQTFAGAQCTPLRSGRCRARACSRRFCLYKFSGRLGRAWKPAPTGVVHHRWVCVKSDRARAIRESPLRDCVPSLGLCRFRGRARKPAPTGLCRFSISRVGTDILVRP